MKKFVAIFIFFAFLMSFSIEAFPHCQVPCGIYGDEMRFEMMDEDIDTIEKSMKKSVAKKILARWNSSPRIVPTNKEICDIQQSWFKKFKLNPMLTYDTGSLEMLKDIIKD